MRAYLGLGSNIGDREGFLRAAVECLNACEAITVEKVSSVYETEPVGYVEQEDFLNAAVRIETDLTSEELLATCLAIENELGRRREVHWGPRTIDIDILLFGDMSVEMPALKIPHPLMDKRRFVLVPLFEIFPDLILRGKRIDELLAELGDEDEVRVAANNKI